MAEAEVKKSAFETNILVKGLVSLIVFVTIIFVFTFFAYNLINYKIQDKIAENPDSIKIKKLFLFELKKFDLNLADEGIVRIKVVLEFNRDDKAEVLENMRMKFRDIINSYFIKITKKQLTVDMKKHKQILKDRFNKFIVSEPSLKVKRPFFGEYIPFRLVNIYIDDIIIMNED